MTNERRKMPRLRRRMLVRFRLEDQEKFTSAFSIDIGPLGLFLATSQLDQIGTSLWLEVEIPNQQKVLMRGHVAWCRISPVEFRSMEQAGVGIRLQDAPENWFHFLMQEMQSNNSASKR